MSRYDPADIEPRWQAYWDRAGTTREELQAIEFNVTLPKR